MTSTPERHERSAAPAARGEWTARSFPDLQHLDGLSPALVAEHVKLYEGYVSSLNALESALAALEAAGRRGAPAWRALHRRRAFEWDGMRLHEGYFEALRPRTSDGDVPPALARAMESSWGGVDAWRREFETLAAVRGIGWVLCSLDAASGRLMNHWVTLHEDGHLVGSRPIVVLDMWEHAYLRDYRSAEKGQYVEAFFRNLDFGVCAARLAPAGEGRRAAMH